MTPNLTGEIRVVTFKNFLMVKDEALKATDSMLAERYMNKVQSGPFKGMRLENRSSWNDGNMSTKYVGSYEFELHNSIRKAVSRKPSTIINAGCAEGYYAIGLGRLLPYSSVVAMDMDKAAIDQCVHNAQMNGIINMKLVEGKIGPEDLIQGKGHKLFVVDIEGYELSVLDPERCADLYTSDIIVECHDFLYVGDEEEPTSIISDALEQRFGATHIIERIEPQAPYMRDYPCLSGLTLGTALLAITEKRPLPTVWLACWTKERKH